jgi:hypothetical protein
MDWEEIKNMNSEQEILKSKEIELMCVNRDKQAFKELINLRYNAEDLFGLIMNYYNFEHGYLIPNKLSDFTETIEETKLIYSDATTTMNKIVIILLIDLQELIRIIVDILKLHTNNENYLLNIRKKYPYYTDYEKYLFRILKNIKGTNETINELKTFFLNLKTRNHKFLDGVYMRLFEKNLDKPENVKKILYLMRTIQKDKGYLMNSNLFIEELCTKFPPENNSPYLTEYNNKVKLTY